MNKLKSETGGFLKVLSYKDAWEEAWQKASKTINEEKVKRANKNYIYAGFPYLDREDLMLVLKTNINDDIVVGQCNGFNVVDETLLLGKVQGLRLPLSK